MHAETGDRGAVVDSPPERGLEVTDIVGNETVRSLWDGLSARCGDRVFLVFHDREHRVSEYTYRSFDEEINRAANVFLSIGVKKGERIAVHMHSSPEFMMCLFGLGKIGAIAVPVNEQNKREECEYAVTTCGSRVLWWNPPICLSTRLWPPTARW